MKMKLIFTFLLIFSLNGFAEEEKKVKLPSDDNQIRVSRGLRFSVPADWPMDERNGGISPVGTEEYMLMKFKKIDARLDALEQQMNQEEAPSEQPAEVRKGTVVAGGRLQSFEYKPATLEGEVKENEKASS